MKTFLSKIKAFFVGVFGSSKWEHTAAATIAMLAPLVESIVGYTAGEADAQIVESIVGEVETDLGDVAGLIDQVSSGQKSAGDVEGQVTSILGAVSVNLGKLLTDAHIKDPAVAGKVKIVVKTIIGEVDAIVEEFHPAPAPPVPVVIASTASAPATNVSPNSTLVHGSDHTIPPAE